MWSRRNGICASLSAHPMHFTSTKSLPTSTAEESRKKIAINVVLHGSVRRPKVVPGGCDFHVFHDWALVHVITRPTSGLSVHDLVARANGNWLRLTVSRRSLWVRLGHSGCQLNIRSAFADAPWRPNRAVHPRRRPPHSRAARPAR